jgi:hypothetical protein
VFRLSKKVLIGVACLGIAFAGCGGSSGTPTPSPISDPHQVLTETVNAATNVTSFHLEIDLSGKVNTSALGSSGGLGLGGTMDLAGTKVEGDVDVTKQAADLKLSMPGLMGLTGEAIVVDGNAYYKVSLLGGDKYTKVPLGDLTGGLPVSVPSALPSASGAIADEVNALRDQLQAMGVTTQLLPDDTIDGKAAYHIQVTVPLQTINAALAAESPAMQLDSAGIDIWVYKADLLPAKVEVKGSSSQIGNLDLVILLTNYNKPVTITAPPDSEIAPAS